MKVHIKICGIRSLEAANAALEEGADFIGFNFVPSSNRYIRPEDARKIIDVVRRKILIVGVFQNMPIDEVNIIARQLDLDYIQLHGNEDDTYMKQIERPIIKSMNVSQKIKTLQQQFLLTDRMRQGQGSMVDFTLASSLAKKRKIFFAGGLTPENVSFVIEKVKPFAVDVAGGIETDGNQDLGKIKGFIRNAKGVTL